MTDARLPGHWLYDPTLDALSDRAWRTFGGSLMWSVDQGTDGYLPQRSLRFLHPAGVDDATAAELVAAGRWAAMPDGYQVLDWEKSQTLAKDVEWQRERNRLKNKALRERERERAAGQQHGQLPGHVTGHAGGEARLGEERSGKEALDATTYVSGSDDGPPCDVCQSRPSRANSAGARLCREHNPNLFRDAA